jgi:MFS family permease
MKNSVRPWRVLAERDFGLFWSSLLVSAIGSQLTSVAIAWQIYEMTSSPLQLGLTGLFRAVPIIIFALTGGWLADRMDRRRLLIITHGLEMLLSLLLGLLTDAGLVKVWHIYSVTFFSGALMMFDQPARSAMIPNLVPREHLATAFALNITLRQTGLLTGPFLAGAIIAWVGLTWSYYIDAVTFLAVILALLSMRIRQAEAAPKREPALRSMYEGFAFVWNNSVILGLLVMDTCVTFFGAYSAMMPVFARDILGVGPTGLGALLGAPALGALAGSTVVMSHRGMSRKPRLIVPITLLYTMGLILFGLSRWFALSFLIAFVLGALDAAGETLRMTLIQLLTPDQLRGRVQGLVHLFVVGGPFMGHAQIGVVASILGAPGAVIVGGLIGSAIVGWMAKNISELRADEA